MAKKKYSMFTFRFKKIIPFFPLGLIIRSSDYEKIKTFKALDGYCQIVSQRLCSAEISSSQGVVLGGEVGEEST